MRALSSTIALICLTAAVADSQQVPDSLRIETVRLADDIYLLRAPSDLDLWTSANALVIVNDTDVTVFDNSARSVTSRMMLAEIRRITDKPVTTLINSHWHMDHWSGNSVFQDSFPGLRIIASEETAWYMSLMPAPYFSNMVGLNRARARLDTAMTTGRLPNGSPFTAEARRRMEENIALLEDFTAEVAGIRRVLPTVTYRDRLTFWSGSREFQLLSLTGDATGSTVLFLPRERVLATGDVLVRREGGEGPPAWTMNSYDVSEWLQSLRILDDLNAEIIVPGQGPALRGEEFLHNTIALYDELLTQTHAAMRAGAFTYTDVRARINLDAVRRRFTNDDPALNDRFDGLAADLIRRAIQEAHDGVATLP